MGHWGSIFFMRMQHARLTGFKLAPMLQFSGRLTTRKDMTICEMKYRLLKVSINSLTVKTSMDCGTIQYCFHQIFFSNIVQLYSKVTFEVFCVHSWDSGCLWMKYFSVWCAVLDILRHSTHYTTEIWYDLKNILVWASRRRLVSKLYRLVAITPNTCPL